MLASEAISQFVSVLKSAQIDNQSHLFDLKTCVILKKIV